jgi:hypothetical protein
MADHPCASPWTYRCTDCGHWFSDHEDSGCRHASDELPDQCACAQTMDALLASYGPPFPPLTGRGRYARRIRCYRLRNEPWVIVMRGIFATLRAYEHELPELPFPTVLGTS